MTLRQLTLRSVRHYFRAHLGALAGATAAAAVLIGALAVGDSVRESLKAQARERTGAVSWAIRGGDRFFRQDLLRESPAATLLQLSGTVTRQDGSARANRVQVLGVRRDFLHVLRRPADGQTFRDRHARLGDRFNPTLEISLDAPPVGTVSLNASLARALNASPGDELVLRIHKPSALSRDAVVTPRDDQSVALRLKVGSILPPGAGNFSLDVSQSAPFTVWVDQDELAKAAGLHHRANLLLYPGGVQAEGVGSIWTTLKERLSTPGSPPGPVPGSATLKEALNQQAYRESFSGRAKLPPPEEDLQAARKQFDQEWTLEDAELGLPVEQLDPDRTGGFKVPPFVELNTRRIFLEPAAVRAALPPGGSNHPPATPLLTYLVNSLSTGTKLTPYSMITAAGAPYTPADLKDDEIVINEWLARDLGIGPGATLQLAYYRVDAGTRLEEHTNTFRVHSVVPMRGLHADRTLMPEFPGLSKAESTRDWDAGFDLVHTIRDQDEAYWKQWRGTPKAFITLAAGQKLWANRFGDLTAIRWFATNPAEAAAWKSELAGRIRKNLDPADVGLAWTPVRGPAMRAATSGQDFGGLFIGFSFFLIVSALLLTSMLFQFGLEQRATETGILLAIGWPPGKVRGLLFREGVVVATLGTVLGAGLGALYARGVIWGLSTLWRDAVAGAGIQFFLTPTTLGTGMALSVAVAAGTLWFALRRQARRPARQLLNQGALDLDGNPTGAPPWVRWTTLGSGVAGLALTGAAWAVRVSRPETFFGAGALLLVAVLTGSRWWLSRQAASGTGAAPVRTLVGLALRGLSRRPSRSVGTLALLASAAFMIVAVAANRLDATRNARQRSAGTGGFAFWGETTLPVLQDLNTPKGQESFGLNPADLREVSFVGFRVRDGDDASCLNLNRAQRPRLLGVKPGELARRGAFTFTKLLSGITVTNGWLALEAQQAASVAGVPVIPAIGDANSIQWALGQSVGGTLDFVDERGRPFQVRLVGAVANSILQGSLVIADADFTRLFPSESGQRALLIDAPPDAPDLAARLSRALQDVGLELTPAARRLDQFNAVQNTYLNTFQVLGGLGLLLGSVGLGVVVLRNVFERRGELALLQAVGFSRTRIRRLLLAEHLALLLGGLGLGTLTAAIAVLPSLITPGSGLPTRSLALTLAVVFLNGLVWTVGSVQRALRGRLLDGLRDL